MQGDMAGCKRFLNTDEKTKLQREYSQYVDYWHSMQLTDGNGNFYGSDGKSFKELGITYGSTLTLDSTEAEKARKSAEAEAEKKAEAEKREADEREEAAAKDRVAAGQTGNTKKPNGDQQNGKTQKTKKRNGGQHNGRNNGNRKQIAPAVVAPAPGAAKHPRVDPKVNKDGTQEADNGYGFFLAVIFVFGILLFIQKPADPESDASSYSSDSDSGDE